MAARIPVIEQTSFAGGAGPSYLQPIQASDAIGRGISSLGNALGDVASANQDLENARTQRDKMQRSQDAAIWAGSTLSDAQLQWQQTLQQDKVDPGLTANGADGFTPKLLAKYDAWAKDAIEKAPNVESKRYLAQHLNSLRTSLGDNAIGFEARAKTDYRVDQRMTSMDSASQAVMGAPTKDNFLSVYAQQKAVNDALDVEPELRRKLNDQLRDKMVSGYWLGRIRQDPAGAMQELGQGLGPSQTEEYKFGASPAAGGGGAAGAGTSFKGEPGMPAGMRNDNPFNIKYARQSDAVGPSENRDQGDPQAVYADAPTGVAAGYRLALKKYDGGKRTLNQLIAEQGGWTPGNYQAAANVAGTMGIKPDEDINLRAPGVLEKFGRALITQEQGAANAKVSDAMLRDMATQVLQGGARPVILTDATGSAAAPEKPAPTGNSILDATPMNIRLQMMQHADTEMSRSQAIWRSQLTNTEGDHVAAYMNGQAVATPLTQQDYMRAYGPIEGGTRFENYKSIASVGGDIAAMKLATPDQLVATVARYVPDAAKPGYEAAVKRYQLVATAADQVNKARQDDPIAYAQQAKIGNASTLDFSNADKFGAELRNRVGVAETMQAKYGTPYQLLTKTEAQTLQQGFQGMTTQQKLGYLTTINRSVTDPKAYRAVMQQIAPDSPVTAVAGNILQKQNPLVIAHTFSADEYVQQQDVAARILEGEALINPTKSTKAEDGKGKLYPMPKDQDMRDAFNGVVGKAFAGDPIAADAAFQAVKAYYAGQGSKDGDISGQLDSGRLKASINAVVGVSDINGNGEVVRPWGMSESKFKTNLEYEFNRQMQAAGLKGTAQDSFGAYGLQMVQDSKYLLRTGTGYLVDQAGNPIVLDLTTRPASDWKIPGAAPPPALHSIPTVVQPKAPKLATTTPSTK